MDRGAVDSPRAVAPALPLVLRDDAGGVEAPAAIVAAGRGPDRPARPAVPRPVPDRAAAARAADRPFSIYGFLFLNPVGVLAFWARLHRAATGARLVRVPARPGVAPGALGDAAPAVRLPPAHVPGRHRVGADRASRVPPPLAPDRTQRRDRGRELRGTARRTRSVGSHPEGCDGPRASTRGL